MIIPNGDKMDEMIIALDIETLNLDMEKEGLSFDNPAGWTTSCVCIYDAYFQEEFYYVQDDFIRSLLNSNRSLNKLERTVREMKYLSQDLEGWFKDGYSLLTHNGTNFDIPILKKSIEDGGGSCESVFESDFKHIDMSHSLKQMTTFRYKLQHLVKGMLGEERSKLMEAQFAPVEWDKGNYAYVIQYCIQDCILNYEVFTECASQGEIRAIGDIWDYPVVPFTEFENFINS